MEKIVFLERDTFKVKFRRPQFDYEWIDYAETAPPQVVERLHGATIAICNKLPLRASESLTPAATKVNRRSRHRRRQH